MPYKDPAKQRAAVREAARRRRARSQLQKLADELATLPEPPSRDELLRILGAQARQGHVTAIKTLLEEYRRDGNDDTGEGAQSIIDELRAQREKRAAETS